MKLLLLMIALTVPSWGAGFSIDLAEVGRAIKARHDQVPARVKWRRITAGLAAAASVGDMVTTYQGIGRGACELNPFLQLPDKCGLNKARFNRVKIGLFIWLGPGQEIVHRLPHGDRLDRDVTIANAVTAALYTGVSIHNARQ